MSGTLYLAWRYLAYHRLKTAILMTSITLILYLPVGLRVLVEQSSRQLTARAAATPLVVGSKGSALELILNALYFGAESPEPIPFAEVTHVDTTGFARAIPMFVRFHARGHAIVGTSLEYFEFRDLRIAEGRGLAMLGECVVGSRAAASLGVGPGGHVISSPESVFDIAGVYPLKMRVAGVLGFTDGPDDDAIFVDVKTAWIIQGLGHGHQDLSAPAAASGVLERDGSRITANASVVQYNEITDENIDSFHFHGDLSTNPLTAVIAVPHDRKSSALLQGRYQTSERPVQIARPVEVMDELLATVLTVQRFVVAGAVILGLATLSTAALVFLLSLRLRKREIATLLKIGGSRSAIASVMASEIVFVLTGGALLAGGLTGLTGQFGSLAIRAILRLSG
jgi:putative ABC transport system permease protein